MTHTLKNEGRLFTGEEDGFELGTSPGVTVRPLLARKGGHAVDLFYLTIAEGAEVIPETHPYSETLVVVGGELTCSIVDGPRIVVRPGQIGHIPADTWHDVRNSGLGRAHAAMFIGV